MHNDREVWRLDIEDSEMQSVFRKLDHIIEVHGQKPGQLIRVLQGAQEIFGYLPEEVQTFIAGKMNIPVSEVNGVVTFYSLFSTEPRGKNAINVCLGTACYVQGAAGVLEDFRRELGLKDGDTTDDGLFTVKSTRCIGACGLAPVLTVNDHVHGKLSRKDVAKILRKYRRDAEENKNDREYAGFTGDHEQLPAGP
jgi:NADH:ubiquinone oxidoreductase subunit E